MWLSFWGYKDLRLVRRGRDHKTELIRTLIGVFFPFGKPVCRFSLKDISVFFIFRDQRLYSSQYFRQSSRFSSFLVFILHFWFFWRKTSQITVTLYQRLIFVSKGLVLVFHFHLKRFCFCNFWVFAFIRYLQSDFRIPGKTTFFVLLPTALSKILMQILSNYNYVAPIGLISFHLLHEKFTRYYVFCALAPQ